MAVLGEKSRLVPLKAIPTGNPTPMANAAVDIPPVITVDVIRPVFTIPAIILNRFIFLAIRSRASISSRKNASISGNLFDMIVVLAVPQGLTRDRSCLLHCRIYSSLFNSWR